MNGERGKLGPLDEQAGDFRDAAGTDAVEDLHDALDPAFAEGSREGLINRTLADRGKLADFVGQTLGLDGLEHVGNPDGGGIEIDALAAADHLVAGGKKLEEKNRN